LRCLGEDSSDTQIGTKYDFMFMYMIHINRTKRCLGWSF